MAYKPATGVLLALALMVAVPAQAAPAVIWDGLSLGMSVPEAKLSHPEMMALPAPVPRAGFARYVMQGPSIGSCLSNVDVNFLGGRLASVEVHALTDTDSGDVRICAEEWGRAVRQKYGQPLFDVRTPMTEKITWNANGFSVTTHMRVVNTVVVYSVSYQASRRTAAQIL
ncbi:hypothetical protein [Gluconobacter roseus]|uniref:Uncharacterized protein n=1 Tax=Gluconobacter roseus NBRC 3990 TaxID=1307950 RepID=A0A4Y3M8T0_9PROT|nr:hypothetical protein [Gluconobacter roseus]KXV44693.1 hypothetical protein AD943_02380 [Gluconobacter roseus]GBR43662.1 hypothetical protein AA3990_0500 [Gluconobacter roseus NBRC 3990]GEB04963.1 hypothetical protein GRO01_25390 [Gluconobacter roseus NBRC 3990]GLP94491.1 hypothetical protein GCM10007871_24690 [Gluconobacter roseus NBRC 3990]